MQTLLIVAMCVNVVACCVAAYSAREARRLRIGVAGYAAMLRAGYLAQFDRPEA